MKIVCIGNAAYDITIPTEEYPTENTKTRVEEMIECGGGPASNTAYLLGKWGLDVAFLGVVGADSHGNWIRKELNEAKVNTAYLEMNPIYPTPTAYVIANKAKGTRTVLSYRNPMKMKKVSLAFDPDYILTDGQEFDMSKKLIKQYPNAITIMDAGRMSKEIVELAKMCNYVICSKDFAEEMTGIRFDYSRNETIRDIFLALKKIFTGNIIVTLESKGSLYELGGIIKIMPSIEVQPVDSTGAGDIFHGAFIYGLASRYGLEKILKIANVAGALSTEHIGGRFSVPDKEEIRKIIHDFE